MYRLRRKGAPGSGTELSSVLKEISRLEKILTFNGIKGVTSQFKEKSDIEWNEGMTSGKDPTQLTFPLEGIKEKPKK